MISFLCVLLPVVYADIPLTFNNNYYVPVLVNGTQVDLALSTQMDQVVFEAKGITFDGNCNTTGTFTIQPL